MWYSENPGDEILAEYERFFLPLAPTLEAFAARHHLRIERYQKGQANWSFIFRMGEDGSLGHLQVLRIRDDQVLVVAHREQRDFQHCVRLIGAVGEIRLKRDDPQLAEQLKAMLAKIVNVPKSELRPDRFDWASRRDEFLTARGLFAAEPLVSLD
jgi:hypothetical protein